MRSVRVKALLVGLMLLTLVGVLATRESGPDRMTTHLVGQGAPPIEGTTTSGEAWRLDLQRGRWVVVNFFSTTCVPCVREHPELVAFAEAHAEADDVRVVTVAFADSPAAVEEFFRSNGGDWPVLVTDTGGGAGGLGGAVGAEDDPLGAGAGDGETVEGGKEGELCVCPTPAKQEIRVV